MRIIRVPIWEYVTSCSIFSIIRVGGKYFGRVVFSRFSSCSNPGCEGLYGGYCVCGEPDIVVYMYGSKVGFWEIELMPYEERLVRGPSGFVWVEVVKKKKRRKRRKGIVRT